MHFGPGRAPRAGRLVRPEWEALRATAPPSDTFDRAMTTHLPEPVGRWLKHAITPGTPLWEFVELEMHGEIRVGSWRRFTARQILRPSRGYIWAATARFSGLPVLGYDRLSSGTAQMRWRMLGVVPVLSASGADVARSAAGRLAGEGVLVPTAFRQATWQHPRGKDTARACWHVDGQDEHVDLHVGPDGRLLEVVLQRWGNPGGAPFGRYPFGVGVEAERTFAGVTIPSALRAAWWWGTDRQDEGEFFRAEITAARFG